MSAGVFYFEPPCICVCLSVCQSQDDIGVSTGTPHSGTLGRNSVPVIPGAVSSDVMSEMTLRLRERRAKLENDESATTTTTTSVC